MPTRLLLAAVLVFVTACSPTPSAAPTAGQPTAAPQLTPAGGGQAAASTPLTHLRFATTANASGSAPVYIGLERGYFRDAGIDLELVSFPGGAQLIPSIAASQVGIA